jgi:hypothetical protein
MDEVSQHQPQADPATGIVIEALSREDGKNSTVRVFRDRIEWHKERSISSLPRPSSDPPVIPLSKVSSVKAKKDGPLFSKVVMRTDLGTIVFRMHSPQAVEVRDAIAGLLAAGPVAPDEAEATPPPPPPPPAAPAQDDLAQLEWLRDEGMLSPEQFEAARTQLGPP